MPGANIVVEPLLLLDFGGYFLELLSMNTHIELLSHVGNIVVVGFIILLKVIIAQSLIQESLIQELLINFSVVEAFLL